MEALECIKGRRSIRRFTDEKIPADKIRQLVDMAAYAPSWKNTQVVRYMAVQDQVIKSRIADNCVLGFTGNTAIIKDCPVLMLITIVQGISGYEKTGEPSTSKADRWEVFDAGIATQTFCLAANDMGLGTVIMGVFDEDKVAKAVDLPKEQAVAAMVALGYPDIAPNAPRRKNSDVLLTWK
jgi:Nitroreductase